MTIATATSTIALLLLAQAPAAPMECNQNQVLERAMLIGDEIRIRLGDGRLKAEDMNGPLGQAVNQANTPLGQGRLNEACSLYEAIIVQHGMRAAAR